MKKLDSEVLLLILGGFLAGIANGLLGAGGGIIIVLVLSKLTKSAYLDPRDIFANALCVMFPLSVVSTVSYAIRGGINAEGFKVYLIPAIIGGIVGGLLLGRIGTKFLRFLFSGIMIYSGISLMVR